LGSKVKLELPSKMDYLGIPDVILMEIGSELECCSRALEELGASVIEACTNAMEHGNKLDEDRTIEILFELEDRLVTVTVLDDGPGFDFQTWQPSSELMRVRGRGILIMREFTDSLTFDRHPDGRFLVRLTKKLVPPPEDD
jgi:serine/threonine-protein kinase RsbW